MKNRVYGIVGIKSKMSNWNADFSGNPKTTSSDIIFGSDKAFKYPIKKFWENNGNKVLYIKSLISDTIKIKDKNKEEYSKDVVRPKSLVERYNEIFSPSIVNDRTDSKEILNNLFSAIDVLNFGATFAEKKQNISITGAVQVGQGFNKYEDTSIETQDILSPFRDSSQPNALASTLGTKIVTDEAHYVYPITINPENYNNYIGIIDNFEGYKKTDYEEFKKACCIAATALNTNSKIGCENEFTIFIECKEGSKIHLSNLDNCISVSKDDNLTNVKLNNLPEIINIHSSEIENVDVYYNPHKGKIEGLNEINCSLSIKNIYTFEDIEGE
jgi:CRISPR-associated protein Csh2